LIPYRGPIYRLPPPILIVKIHYRDVSSGLPFPINRTSIRYQDSRSLWSMFIRGRSHYRIRLSKIIGEEAITWVFARCTNYIVLGLEKTSLILLFFKKTGAKHRQEGARRTFSPCRGELVVSCYYTYCVLISPQGENVIYGTP